MNAVAPSGRPQLALENVSFAVGGRPLLTAIDLDLKLGGCLAILGPNGAGKSLLLRLCHGLLTPSEGTVRWNGEVPSAGIRRRQAMVFQKPVMLRRSALANVAYPLKLAGRSKQERQERARAALDLFGLADLAARPARVLSGGEQQRLALARAWVVEPEVLFLDEPTASLDPAASYHVEMAVRTFLDAGTVVLLVTHDIAQARRLADEVVFMFRGRLHERAPAVDFFTKPKTPEAQAFVVGDLIW